MLGVNLNLKGLEKILVLTGELQKIKTKMGTGE